MFVICTPVLACILFFIVRRVAPLYGKLQVCMDRVNAAIQENLTAIRAVKAFVREEYEEEVFEKANRELVQRINEMLHLMEDYDIVGRSKAMHNLAELALRVSHVRSTVLITGESGVGKDVFCRMICRFAGSPDYIKISCGNLPENLLESELFGYEAGAFTGANRTGKRGIFELAGDGVIFLDEIGELRPSSRSSC